MTKKVLVAGFTGAMGQKAVNLVNSLDNFELVAGMSPTATNDPQKYNLPAGAKIYQSLAEIPDLAADIWIDFTTPKAVYDNVKFALEHHISPVVGTTGMSDEQEAELIKISQKEKVGGLIAPNFGMSAVLLMKFAKEAAKYFPDAEIIEMHHADKKDAPSGTALATAKMIAKNRPEHETAPDEVETLENVRGGDYQGIKIHSVRLPGYIAHEQVLFGGPGEALTIRQDSFDRESFMGGVKVALEKVDQLDELVVGLENIL
ncbi:MAG: 4-hydroxy-tetrahydrodipicolinate reductase [Lactobacillus amylovorus]|jgi:4-hydroxy-tetrahydrodipicolinate reductase|uniref:4-hydroxy-tetrahydrodipicolinate reductase n=2 Tax=Lactobacillus amylovorus subsp. animalium TaxID=3378536 RepID=A0A0R2KN14_LACAM|nr:4-hydroxy-tetrahydrodipicolinate reductase [Lactobacillus amylovorus]KRN90899.1 dihydrodipicolinate reductase [Lactobacillus amylovorus DSM 16698]MDB6221282.1 4-hydroxy-tetrahydrodipicolinate reductase [Lactobacillus amylovorus]MDB6231929.1 4-hydroxy-tetrahydrodipicolinate reductase [Lactobacillus amylovorus]MDB6255234.1 4-hydroxy-tetrahydrodipicolinate reductase [Lactobacillus amylovorus]MDB6259472.1 4-hydroxy-tetrahydrodipicolinate reductase [Lactobacillus amylovorus]